MFETLRAGCADPRYGTPPVTPHPAGPGGGIEVVVAYRGAVDALTAGLRRGLGAGPFRLVSVAAEDPSTRSWRCRFTYAGALGGDAEEAAIASLLRAVARIAPWLQVARLASARA